MISKIFSIIFFGLVASISHAHANTNICASTTASELADALSAGASANSICAYAKPDPSRVGPFWLVLLNQTVERSSIDWSALDAMGVNIVNAGMAPDFVNTSFWGRGFRYKSELTNFELAARLRLLSTVTAFLQKGYVVNSEVGSSILGELAFFNSMNPVIRDGVAYPNPISADKEYWRAYAMIKLLMISGVSPYRVRQAGTGTPTRRSVLYYMLTQRFPGDLLISVIEKWDFISDPTPSKDFIDAAEAGGRSDLVIGALKKRLSL